MYMYMYVLYEHIHIHVHVPYFLGVVSIPYTHTWIQVKHVLVKTKGTDIFLSLEAVAFVCLNTALGCVGRVS